MEKKLSALKCAVRIFWKNLIGPFAPRLHIHGLGVAARGDGDGPSPHHLAAVNRFHLGLPQVEGIQRHRRNLAAKSYRPAKIELELSVL